MPVSEAVLSVVVVENACIFADDEMPERSRLDTLHWYPALS